MHERLKDTLQDCNINFLIGSGMSYPYLQTLGNIELLLTELDGRAGIGDDTRLLIRASLYKKYFDEVISKNPPILKPEDDVVDVLNEYRTFLKLLNSILLRRKMTLLSKEINLFTTNIDIFLEKALEDLKLEYNDGFTGRFMPTFSLSNFKKCHFKKSLHYDNVAELPVFNLVKLHGSLSWQLKDTEVVFSSMLKHVATLGSNTISPDHILGVPSDATIDSLITAAAGKAPDASTRAFLASYDELLIVVNPTKEKFKHTLLNQTYYELLRLYANELEKENTVLFAMGFSFADEHIRDITLRAANSNPTLMIYVFAHSSEAKALIQQRIGDNTVTNSNLHILAPEQEQVPGQPPTDKFQYDFPSINRLFSGILKQIDNGRGSLEEVQAKHESVIPH